MDLHRLAELRSIAYHRAVAAKLRAEPGLVAAARERLDTWERSGAAALVYIARWRQKLALPIDELVAFLGEDDEEARELRQSTPFAGVIDPRERWRLWREVAESADTR